MKQITFVFLIGSVLPFNSAFALETSPRLGYSVVGERCTKEADEKGLLNKEWRAFMAKCVDKHREHKPQRQLVAGCRAKHADKKRDEWVNAMESCLTQKDK